MPTSPSPTAKRTAAGWALLLAVWSVGLGVWSMYLTLIAFVFAKVVMG
jgi:hypothetical protein